MRCSDYSEFEGGEPITPFQQMLYYPPHSAYLLPPSYGSLMTDSDSPLAKYYPSLSSLDLTWTKKEYDAIIYLPIIHEQDLFDAIASCHCDDSLTEDEKLRNSAEPEYIFSYSQKESSWPTPLDSSFFPAIEKCHCKRKAIKCFEDVYTKVKRKLIKKTNRSVFSSLYPLYGSIRHTTVAFSRPSARDPTKKEYLLTKTIKTIIKVNLNYPSFYDTEKLLIRLGREYLGRYIRYDYPRNRVGQVVKLFSYEYGCRLYEKGSFNNDVHVYPLNIHKQYRVEGILMTIHKRAMDGYYGMYHDIGSLDIEKDVVIARIRPIYHICRNQDSQDLYPFFSHQYIDYPLSLTHIENSPNVLGGTQSLSSYAPDTIKEGDPVVYIGSELYGDILLRGSVGVVTTMRNNSLIIRLAVTSDNALAAKDDQKWFSKYELEKQIPVQYRPLLNGYLRRYTCPRKDRKIALGIKPMKDLVREGLVQYDPDYLVKGTGLLPAYVYSYLALNSELKKTRMRIQYSEQAVKLAQEFFQQFGDALLDAGLFLVKESLIHHEEKVNNEEMRGEKEVDLSAIGMDSEGEEDPELGEVEEEEVEEEEEEVEKEKTNTEIQGNEMSKEEIEGGDKSDEVKKLNDNIDKWMQENIECYRWIPAYMIRGSKKFIRQLLEREVKTVSTVIMCTRKEILVREKQYNVISDIVLRQPLPSLGHRVVVVQHASIPFGSQGTVVAVNPSTLWLEVILDKPSYAGVSFDYHLTTEDCIGRCV